MNPVMVMLTALEGAMLYNDDVWEELSYRDLTIAHVGSVTKGDSGMLEVTVRDEFDDPHVVEIRFTGKKKEVE